MPHRMRPCFPLGPCLARLARTVLRAPGSIAPRILDAGIHRGHGRFRNGLAGTSSLGHRILQGGNQPGELQSRDRPVADVLSFKTIDLHRTRSAKQASECLVLCSFERRVGSETGASASVSTSPPVPPPPFDPPNLVADDAPTANQYYAEADGQWVPGPSSGYGGGAAAHCSLCPRGRRHFPTPRGPSRRCPPAGARSRPLGPLRPTRPTNPGQPPHNTPTVWMAAYTGPIIP